MKRNKTAARKAALYDPYLDVMGGGEKHILSILKVLEEEGYEISIFWDDDLTRTISNTFNLRFRHLQFIPNIFHTKGNFLRKWSTLKKFDTFLYVTDGSYFFSPAKHTYVFCMVPLGDLYQRNFINMLKTFNSTFISNSQFTKKKLWKWKLYSKVTYPYLDDEFINTEAETLIKDNIILSVGRFFRQLHAKRQDVIITLFKKFKRKYSSLKDFKLILVGGLKEQDKDYFDILSQAVEEDLSIILKPNISYGELVSLYKRALIFWHFTGYGVDEEKHPELVEHLGMAPLEAMASGCMTICYDAGGPKELIQDRVNGFLFRTERELALKTLTTLNNRPLRASIQKNAKKFVKENFSYEVFRKRVREVIKP